MVIRDVLKVLKLHSPTVRAILRTFKTTFVPRHHEVLSRSYDFLYIPSYLIWKLIALDGKIKTTSGHFAKLKQFTV